MTSALVVRAVRNGSSLRCGEVSRRGGVLESQTDECSVFWLCTLIFARNCGIGFFTVSKNHCD